MYVFKFFIQNKRADLKLIILIIISGVSYALFPFFAAKLIAENDLFSLLKIVLIGSILILTQNRSNELFTNNLINNYSGYLSRIFNELNNKNTATDQTHVFNSINSTLDDASNKIFDIAPNIGSILIKVVTLMTISTVIVLNSLFLGIIWFSILIYCIITIITKTRLLKSSIHASRQYDRKKNEYLDLFNQNVIVEQMTYKRRQSFIDKFIKLTLKQYAESTKSSKAIIDVWKSLTIGYLVALALFVYIWPSYFSVESEKVLFLVFILALSSITEVAYGAPKLILANFSAERLSLLERYINEIVKYDKASND